LLGKEDFHTFNLGCNYFFPAFRLCDERRYAHQNFPVVVAVIPPTNLIGVWVASVGPYLIAAKLNVAERVLCVLCGMVATHLTVFSAMGRKLGLPTVRTIIESLRSRIQVLRENYDFRADYTLHQMMT
jgi:hypothetical protein